MMIGDNVGFERQFVDLHLRACIYAGLEMYGCVREMNPSQVRTYCFQALKYVFEHWESHLKKLGKQSK